MQAQYYSKSPKNSCIAVAVTLWLSTAGLQAAQHPFTDPVDSGGNNFTMLDATGSTVGGTNDVKFTWDGTLNDAVADAVSNATLSSDEAFFGVLWDAHDIVLYGPGTYTIYDGCDPGDADCGVGNAVTFTVGDFQFGAHILFDWGSTLNIDVINVWNTNRSWLEQNPLNPFWAGPDNGGVDGSECTPPGNCVVDGLPNDETTEFNFISTDVNGNGIAGSPMTDGAFVGFGASFDLNGITFPNIPPTANDFARSTVVDTPIIIDLTTYTTDPDGEVDPASVAIVPGSGPTNGTLVNNGGGTVEYSPNPGFEGDDSFEYTIDDNFGETSNAATVTLTVTAVANNLPLADDASLETDEDISLDIAVNSVASDADGDTLTFENFDSTSAKGGTVTVDATNTILTYTPAAEFSGSDTFSYWVTDSLDSSNVATITVTVNEINDPLVCTDVTLNTDTDTPLDIDVADDLLSTCTDPEGETITLSGTTQPTVPGSTLSDDGAGTLTYTPATGFNGRDNFTYTATDGATFDTRTVFVDVGKIFSNFTMLDGDGVTFGGTNDVVFTWDGTCYNSVAEADAGPENMIMGSDSNFPFFGFPWFAHDIKVYCPGGPYTVDSCNEGVTPPSCGPLTWSVPVGHLGAHILFDWNITADIDVATVWNNSTGGTWETVVPNGQLYQGPAGPTPALDEFYEWISVDGDGDGIPGIKFVDGPFINFRANYNYKTTAGGGGEIDIPESSIPSPNLGSATSGCSIGKTPRNVLNGGDWLVVFGFIAWLGIGVCRGRQHKLH